MILLSSWWVNGSAIYAISVREINMRAVRNNKEAVGLVLQVR